LLQRALQDIKSQFILLKNENHLLRKLIFDDIIVSGKPVGQSDDGAFQTILNYLHGEIFAIEHYVGGRIPKSLAFAVRERLAKGMEAAKVRDAIHKIHPAPSDDFVDNLIRGKQEKLRYA
jgi:hypothetical protein